jgi:type II secretory pathway pseudopilin PulG
MRRSGFTLPELVISISLMMVVFAIVIPFFRIQSLAVERDVGRMESTQNARFVQNIIDRELRLAGGETGQPLIVEATSMSVTFNVNLVSNIADDPSAVFIDEDADSLAVWAWPLDRADALPITGTVYPEANYTDASGILSGAETISYWVVADSQSTRADVYQLWRRVNDRPAALVARDLLIPADTNWFFRYSRVTATGELVPVPDSSLPIDWRDTTRLADSVRVVQMRVSGLFRDDRMDREIIQTVYGSTRLINAGLLKQRTCGTAPLPPEDVTATVQLDASNAPTSVRVEWNASPEEAGGERDVTVYLVQRRLTAGMTWTTLRNVPASGTASYAFEDFDLAPGSWTYGVFSQDCSPANSAVESAASVDVP